VRSKDVTESAKLRGAGYPNEAPRQVLRSRKIPGVKRDIGERDCHGDRPGALKFSRDLSYAGAVPGGVCPEGSHGQGLVAFRACAENPLDQVERLSGSPFYRRDPGQVNHCADVVRMKPQHALERLTSLGRASPAERIGMKEQVA
jgi:hypothetical protein